MQISLKNIGRIKSATFEVADLTVICGENNTGKTYATYALYGFLANWRGIAASRPDLILPLEQFVAASGQVDLEPLLPQVNQILGKLAAEYVRGMGKRVFAGSDSQFDGSQFGISLPSSEQAVELARASALERTVNIAVGRGADQGTVAATVGKAAGSLSLETTRADPDMPLSVLHKYVVSAVADVLIKPNLPDAFIASAERTGAAVFRRDLDFAKTRALEAIGMAKPKDLKDRRFRMLLEAARTGYPQPVEDNVEFVRNLEVMSKDVSRLAAGQPQLLESFVELIGGEFKVSREMLYFAPTGSRVKLTMTESSSSVRALLDVGFYLRHAAEPGDLLMIDEPELNLHPKNQRKLARLLVALVNAGVRVFITTHSDYIIREFNTLIMLNREGPDEDIVRERFGYAPSDRLDAARVRLYTTQRSGRSGDIVLNPAPISPTEGIEVATFDQTIGEMNRIQDMLMFGAAQ